MFRFAALQSEKAKELSSKFNFDSSAMDTFILIDGDDIYTKSTAALKICRQLKGPIKILYPFIILPKFLRDFVYDLIAKYRYNLFGKRDVCYISPNHIKKFLD